MGRPSADEIRARAVAAAAECFRSLGVQATSVDDLVRESGIARSTLYRHVGDRNELLLAVIVHEIDQLQVALVERLADAGALEDLIVDGVLHAVDLVRQSAVLYELLADPTILADEVSSSGLEVLVDRLRAFVSPLFAEWQPQLRSGLDPAIAVEHLVRVIRSLATFGVEDIAHRRDRRTYLRQTLVPVFLP